MFAVSSFSLLCLICLFEFCRSREQFERVFIMCVRPLSQSQDQIEEERQRVNDSILCLEEELESCRSEGEQWKTQLEASNQE